MDDILAELFARIDEDPTLPKPGDIDALVAYYRNLRAKQTVGGKAKKETGPALKIDLAALGLVKPQAAPAGFKRRV